MAEISFTPSHFGICVSNLQQSLRFYCDGLGFEKAEVFEVGQEFARPLEVDGQVECTSQFLRRGDFAVELLHYRSPGATGRPSQARNQLGITHLSFYVDDIEGAIARVIAAGGILLPDTRFGEDDPASIDIVFLTDPDGTRVELMQTPPA